MGNCLTSQPKKRLIEEIEIKKKKNKGFIKIDLRDTPKKTLKLINYL